MLAISAICRRLCIGDQVGQNQIGQNKVGQNKHGQRHTSSSNAYLPKHLPENPEPEYCQYMTRRDRGQSIRGP